MTRSLFIGGRFLLAGVSILSLAACGGGSSGGGAVSPACDQFDCQALVNNLAENIMLPAVQSFAVEVASLESAIGGYCAALGTGAETTTRDAARTAWSDAMAVWQQVEVMQVGPLIDNTGALKEELYFWTTQYSPDQRACQYDQEVVTAENTADYDFDVRSVRRRGMAALEHLLFNDNLDHTCPDIVTLMSDWNSRTPESRREARCGFAKIVVGRVHAKADELETKWTDVNGYLHQVKNPGTGGRFSSVQRVVNEFSDALFYLEKETNDIKLAEPPGIKANVCGDVGTACPKAVESWFAAETKSHITENMLAFQKLFLGEAPGDANAPGFSDFIVALGETTVAETMEADIEASLAAVDAISVSVQAAVADPVNIDTVTNAYNVAKNLTRQLKNQFVAILGLSIPDTAAGDND